MTVSIANMAQVWFSNSNVYNAISMTISTLGAGGHPNSSLLRYNVDGVLTFKIDASGNIYTTGNVNANNVNCISANADTINANTINVKNIYSSTVNTGNIYTSIIRTVPLTVEALPNAINIEAGSRAFVTDANSIIFMNRAYANGNNAVPVFSNGKYWLIG